MYNLSKVREDLRVIYSSLKNSKDRRPKYIALACVSYILSPIQLIPNWIPIIGPLDDLLVIYIGAKLIRKITKEKV